MVRGAPRARRRPAAAVPRRGARRLLPDRVRCRDAAWCARRSCTTTRRRAGTRWPPTCCCGWRCSPGTRRTRTPGVSALRLVRDAMAGAPTGFGHALCALDLYVGPSTRSRSSATRSRDDTRPSSAEVTDSVYRPNVVLAVAAPDDERAALAVPLLRDREHDGRRGDRVRLRTVRVQAAGDGRRRAAGATRRADREYPARHAAAGDRRPRSRCSTRRATTVKLSDFTGRKLLVYFYPKADTPGCTTQSCAVRDAREDLVGARRRRGRHQPGRARGRR